MKTKSRLQAKGKKYYFSEFSYFDGEFDVTFNIIDVNFDRRTIAIAITRCGKITQDTFDLLIASFKFYRRRIT